MPNQKLIAQGAEAKIILFEKDNKVVKDRIKKSYRIKELDESIRKRRTKKETKLLEKASKIINAPVPNKVKNKEKNKFKITMPYVDGLKLSEHINKFTLKKQLLILTQVGKDIAKLHDNDIIHGDLTTSNMILIENEKGNKIFFIDFGLGFMSKKLEDKTVDIHLLKEALQARHFQNYEKLFKSFLQGYKKSKDFSKVLERLKAVESRGRYRH